MRHQKARLIALCIVIVLAAAGCHKKPAAVATAAPPPAAPPAAKPTATLAVNPPSIERGSSATIEWSTQNATNVRITPDPGSVSATGTRSIRPQQSTTYHLTADGPGGTVEASARLTVTSSPVAGNKPPEKPAVEDPDKSWRDHMKSIYFDYDKYDVRGDQRAILEGDVKYLREHANDRFTIEGYCDERGSEEYNLALGDRRANAVKDALVSMGISADRINTVSFGKERLICSEETESCWQKNRRGDFTRKN